MKPNLTPRQWRNLGKKHYNDPSHGLVGCLIGTQVLGSVPDENGEHVMDADAYTHFMAGVADALVAEQNGDAT